jgi:hypothetical protein
MKTMKKAMVTLALALPVTAIMITGCQSSDTNVEKAREKLKEAKEQVVVANQELIRSLNDSIQLFKRENEEIIISYEKSLTEIKTRLANEKEETQIILEKKLATLEQNSGEMKIRLQEYGEDGRENWVSFKNEFNHDMEELGTAFKDLTVNNVK